MRILVIEDDDQIADFLKRALSAEGHVVTRLDSGIGAVAVVKSGDFDVNPIIIAKVTAD